MRSAKLQTRQLRRVNGRYPTLRVAVQAYFGPLLQWRLEDPAEFDEGVDDWDFDEEEVLEKYYSGTLAAIADGASERQIRGRTYLAKTITETGVTVAIESEVRKWALERTLAQGVRNIGTLDGAELLIYDGFTVFPDGLAIALDERWSEERMARDPEARRNG